MATKARLKWNEEMFSILKWVNSFYSKYWAALDGKSHDFFPFFIEGERVGVIPKFFVDVLSRFPKTFLVDSAKNFVNLHPDLKTVSERSERVDAILREIRDDDAAASGRIRSLAGWRDEHYVVSTSYTAPALMTVERAAAPLFGVKAYGVHVNGVVRASSPPPAATETSSAGLYMWIGRRSATKQTFPGKLDHVAAGGLTAGVPIQEVLIRECMEEASIPEELTRKFATPVSSISYCYSTGIDGEEAGVKPEMEFCFDLPLPTDFTPVNMDGETECFYLWSIERVKDELTSGDFKPNVAVVILDFLVRHGFVHPDDDVRYCDFLEGMHRTI